MGKYVASAIPILHSISVTGATNSCCFNCSGPNHCFFTRLPPSNKTICRKLFILTGSNSPCWILEYKTGRMRHSRGSRIPVCTWDTAAPHQSERRKSTRACLSSRESLVKFCTARLASDGG